MRSFASECDRGSRDIGLLEKELAERKVRLALAKTDLYHRFMSYVDEQAGIAVLEKELAQAKSSL